MFFFTAEVVFAVKILTGVLHLLIIRRMSDINPLLSVQEHGPSGNATIVFLHGGGCAGWMWQPQLESFSDYHCLVPDLPEQGESMEVRPFSIPYAAEQVAALIRKRAVGGRAHVVGLSLGAQTLVALLSLFPEVVERAVISSALVRPLPGAGFINPGLISASFRLFMAPFRNNEAWIRLNMKYAAAVPETYFPQFRLEFQRTTESSFTHIMMENMNFRLPSGLERVTAPTLVLVGHGEYKAMKQSARDLVQSIPNSRGYEIVHPRGLSRVAQHNWNMTEPEFFNQTIRAWLEDCSLPDKLKPI
jgi:pimeloyl-ACP methyl ester carboxylesterase